MGTNSTKSSANKKRQTRSGDTSQAAAGDLSNRTWWIAVILIFVVAAFLRIYDLNLVPLHHDEGVNGNFLVTLVRDGRYHYDPANYHGPTLYYIAAVFPWIIKLLFGAAARDSYGLNTVVIRLVPALFSLGTIVLIFLLRRNLGTLATLAAAILFAISPGSVYLARYFIHESLFVFFTIGIVVASIKFYEARNPIYLLLAAASAAMLFATKETAMISAGVLFLALASTNIYLRLFGAPPARSEKSETSFVEQMGGTPFLATFALMAIIVFVLLNLFFYSSFFTNYPQGVYDALKTFQIWTKTGQAAHVHPPATYISWLISQESPLLFLGVIGAILVLFNPKNVFALFSAFWAFGLIAAYSLVPYKTPWLALNFMLPLALIGGYAIQRVFELERGKLRLPILMLVIAVLINGYQMIDLNFINYDNDNTYYVYVYAHTKRGTKDLVDKIDQLAKEGNEGGRTGITIVSREYWPLPWYLRNYSRVGYFGHMTSSTEPIIIAQEDQREEIESTFGNNYQLVPSHEPGGMYSLRPGVNLLLYKKQQNPQQINPPAPN